MNTVALIDIAAFLAVFGAIVVFGIKIMWRRQSLGHKAFLILVLLLASMLFYLSLAMEGLCRQSIFSKTEDFVSVLLPVFWGFAFCGIQQEKRKSDLKQSELRHRQFIENQPMGLCRTTIEGGGRFIVANTAMAKMLGYESAEHLMESTVVRLYNHPGDRNRLLDRLIKDGRINCLEVNSKKRDGTRVFFSMTMRLIRSDDGTPIEIECTIEDITARKKAELALQEREQLHRQAQRIAKLGHWQIFADSRDLVFSEEMYRILEVDNDKFGGSPEALYERIHPDDRAPVNSKINRAMQNGAKISFVHRLLLPDGRAKYIHTMAHADYENNDRPVRLIGTSQDVTQLKLAEIEREKTERRLLQAQKLEAIGTLAGGIAHDFNNILSSIIGFTELSLHELPPDSQTAQKLEIVLQGGMRARDLVMNILAFSRESEETLKPIQIGPIVKESIKLLRASIPANIEITYNLAPVCGAVLANPVQIHQVVMNLCTNAYHAIGAAGGKITVNMAEVNLGTDDIQAGFDASPGAHVHLEFKDTGQGMDRQTLDKIFDPYFSTKKRGEGTGLGLAVVHGIIKKHLGQIAVNSMPGHGTAFHIFLPCSASLCATDAPENDAPIVGGTEHIVVVDDEQPIAAMMAEFLTGIGYRVTPFTSSEAALSFLKDGADPVDLLVTDMNMPRICGDELSRQVLALYPELPIIICTGFSDNLDEEKAKAIGIRKYLTKPVMERRMAESIRCLLELN